MASGFVFGGLQAQQQQPTQQTQQTTSLFGSSIANPTPSFGASGTTTSTPSLFGTTQAVTTSATGFSFSNPATSQTQQSTGFTLGGVTAPTTSAPATGFSFGSTNMGGAPGTATSTAPTTTTTNTASFGGLGGIPSTVGGPRMSTFALGTDPTTGWPCRSDKSSVLDLPVPPEMMVLVEAFKETMKKNKAQLIELKGASEVELDSVSEQIEDVRSGVVSLTNTMHKQELQTVSLMKDMKDLSKDVELLAQVREGSNYGPSGSSTLVVDFLRHLVEKYVKRMEGYKVEIERAEFSLQSVLGTAGINAADLWASLTATKDTVVVLSAQVQKLHEDLRSELVVHKTISQLLYGSTPKPWVVSALQGTEELDRLPPLDKIFDKTTSSSSTSIDNAVQRITPMFDRYAGLSEPRPSLFIGGYSSASLLRLPPDPNAQNLTLPPFNPAYHASAMGSFLGTASSPATASLKRSKK